MLKQLSDIDRILLPAEKRSVIRQLFADVMISLLDIGFMALFIYILRWYSIPQATATMPLFAANPLLPIIIFFFLFAAKNILAHHIAGRQYHFAYAVAARLSRQRLLQYLRGDYHDHVHTDSSVWLRRISQQPIEFGHHVLAAWQQAASQFLLVLLTATAICIFDPLLFLLLVALLTGPVVLTSLLLRRKMRQIRATALPVSEKTIQYLQEAVSGYVESNIYQKHDFFSRRYSEYQQHFNSFLSKQLAVQHIPSRLLEVFALLGLVLLVTINHYSNDGTIPLVTIAVFMAAAYKIIPGIVKIINCIGQARTYGYTIGHLPAGNTDEVNDHKAEKKHIASVALEHIHFDAGGKSILRNCSFHIRQGDMLGIAGLSGKGKTTLINLIPGFLEPLSGDVIINDAITSMKDRMQYREKIAYVKQQQFLLHDSIRNNITLDDGPCNYERLHQVVRTAGLEELSAQYPEGLDKIIAENGRDISGGQRQRIAIARALYKDADLIILDEPFNELDKTTEQSLLQHFSQLAGNGKMVIFISHNRDSLSWCNKTICLDEN